MNRRAEYLQVSVALREIEQTIAILDKLTNIIGPSLAAKLETPREYLKQRKRELDPMKVPMSGQER